MGIDKANSIIRKTVDIHEDGLLILLAKIQLVLAIVIVFARIVYTVDMWSWDYNIYLGDNSDTQHVGFATDVNLFSYRSG